MRKLLLLLLVVTVVVTGANLHLTNVIETQRDMYARDTVLAYNAGVVTVSNRRLTLHPMWRHLPSYLHDTDTLTHLTLHDG